jgi:histidinol-phosphate aminotransferase
MTGAESDARRAMTGAESDARRPMTGAESDARRPMTGAESDARRPMTGAAKIGIDELPLRDDLRGQSPYGAPQLDVPYALNTNENSFPLPAALVEAIPQAVAAVADGLNRYPDREAVALRGDLAAYLGHGLTADEVWAANGSNEIMQQLLHAFGGPGRLALSFGPTYSMYPEYARNTHTQWRVVPRADDFSIDLPQALAAIAELRPSVIFLASPNNPTGTALPPHELEAVLEAAPGMVIVDEAYAEFRRVETPSALSLLPRWPRLVVTRTMSKAFALAGGRIGYLAAAPAVVQAVQIVRLPYHLSAQSQVVARVALAHSKELLGAVDTLRGERDATVAWLRGQGFEVADSDANFVLFGRFDDRHEVWQALLDRGVLIREVGPAGWLRVSIGTADEMLAFRQALTEVRS